MQILAHAHELMLDGVDERYPARIDNVLRHADSRPDILTIGRSYKNADARWLLYPSAAADA